MAPKPEALLLRSIVENLPDMVFVKDAEELRFVRLNRAAELLLGYPRAALIGKNDYDFFPAEEADFFTRKDREVLERGELLDVPEEPIHTASSGLRWLHTKKIPIFDDDGDPLYLLGISRDITDLREARLELEDREARLSAVLAQFPGAVWTANRDLEVTGAGGTRAGILGLSDEAAIGNPVVDCLATSGDRDDVEQAHRAALDGGSGSFELRAGEQVFEVQVSPLGQEGVIGVALDVTERRRLEAERMEVRLQRAQRMEALGILAGGIAHDFNNLLVGILGYASLAQSRLPPDSRAADDLRRLEAAAERAAELTRQMLAYSGRGRFVVQEVDLSAVVRDMADLLKVSISKRASLVLRLAADLPTVEADLAQLRQVVMNLITNASDAIADTGVPGTIALATRRVQVDTAWLRDRAPDLDLTPGSYVAFEVSDDGCGMDRATQARMFDPFYTTRDAGHGLGLAATLGIVRGHEGGILVESEVGRGTVIEVLLPATQAGPERDVDELRGTILVVDDEAIVRELARATLEHAGYAVLEADDGDRALQVYAEHGPRIDLVLLDMTMPRMDGETTFQELRKLDASVCVILSSGYNEQEATSRFAGQDLAAFLQKPYRAGDLLQAIRDQLGS